MEKNHVKRVKGQNLPEGVFSRFLLSGSTKYSDKESGGMLVWSPYHTIADSKRKCHFLWRAARRRPHAL